MQLIFYRSIYTVNYGKIRNMVDNDNGEKSVSYWNEFYKLSGNLIPHEPSSFAKRYLFTVKILRKAYFSVYISVLELLLNEHHQPVIELGVGNGRDALYFAHHGIKLVGIDISTTAIEVSLALSSAKR